MLSIKENLGPSQINCKRNKILNQEYVPVKRQQNQFLNQSRDSPAWFWMVPPVQALIL